MGDRRTWWTNFRLVAFDCHSGCSSVGEHIEFFYPNTDQTDTAIELETGIRDALGEGLGEADVAGADDSPDGMGNLLIVDHRGHVLVPERSFRFAFVGDREVDIDADALSPAVLVGMNADRGIQHQVAEEHMAETGTREIMVHAILPAATASGWDSIADAGRRRAPAFGP